MSLIGPTGCGKSTMALALLPRRAYVTVIANKPKDRTLDKLVGKGGGYKKITRWPPPRNADRVVLWPKFAGKRDADNQRVQFERALGDMFGDGSWCVYADEVRYLTEVLNLREDLELYWMQGRAIGLSLVACAQRPAWVPRSMYSQATHLFLWRTNDEQDLRALGGLGFADSARIRTLVSELQGHDALYVNTRTGALSKTRVNL